MSRLDTGTNRTGVFLVVAILAIALLVLAINKRIGYASCERWKAGVSMHLVVSHLPLPQCDLIPTIDTVSAYSYERGGRGCRDNLLHNGDVAVDMESTGLVYGDYVLIETEHGLIEGTHQVRDKISLSLRNRIDLYLTDKQIADQYLHNARVWRVR